MEGQFIAIYARVSTEEQAEHGFSIDAQLTTLRDYCKSTGRLVLDEYVDRGVSGKSIVGRPELHRLLEDAKAKKFQEVIVWKINRLARKQLDLLNIVEKLNSYDVAFRSYSENFETETPMGKFALQMMGAVGELERNTIVDNVKLGMKQRARTGQWNGGIVLGYKSTVVRDGSNRRDRETRLEVVPEEAQTIKEIFEQYASGKGLKAITNWLNHRGARTKKGYPFSSASVSGILRNPVYVGKIRYNVHENWSSKRRKGTNKNPIIVKGLHEPIVSQDLWDKVQMLYDAKCKKSPRIFQGSFPLTGIMRCPQCGAGMVAHKSSYKVKDGTRVTNRYYVCGAFQNKGSAVCKSNGVRADEAEQEVYARLCRALEKPKVLQDVVNAINAKRSSGTKPIEEELSRVEKELDSLSKKRDKWYKLYEEDGIDKEMLLSRVKELQNDYDRLSTRRSELRFKIRQGGSAPVPLPLVKVILSRFDKLIATSPPEQRKALLHLLIRRITVKERRKIDTIEIEINETLQKSFLSEGPSGLPEGPFNFKGVMPLTIKL